MHRKCTENAREPGGSKPRSRPSGIPAAKRPALSTLTYPLDLRRGSTRRNVKGRVKVRVDRPGLFRPPNRPEIASPAAGLASRSRAAQSRPEPPRAAQSRPEPPRAAQSRPEPPRAAQSRRAGQSLPARPSGWVKSPASGPASGPASSPASGPADRHRTVRWGVSGHYRRVD